MVTTWQALSGEFSYKGSGHVSFSKKRNFHLSGFPHGTLGMKDISKSESVSFTKMEFLGFSARIHF